MGICEDERKRMRKVELERRVQEVGRMRWEEQLQRNERTRRYAQEKGEMKLEQYADGQDGAGVRLMMREIEDINKEKLERQIVTVPKQRHFNLINLNLNLCRLWRQTLGVYDLCFTIIGHRSEIDPNFFKIVLFKSEYDINDQY
ncbi:hypothetical protein CAPTEDRAFT_206922 [Capitella teleta]|uniref:Uncharacterized protein n=1 Tax=Capitella teleta TaxID=283909 RepID=R7UU64_CAPTE|nr:hypothetical protein CAPTEDRAFT_206922 [Capitella teleta]|eukprot:ELU09730.1 hypothetical protein CAPTEDRAFT_206922 [Capitella teleta]